LLADYFRICARPKITLLRAKLGVSPEKPQEKNHRAVPVDQVRMGSFLYVDSKYRIVSLSVKFLYLEELQLDIFGVKACPISCYGPV